MTRLLPTALALVGALALSPAVAHQGDDGHDDGMLLDCDRLPADALTTVPSPLDAFVQVVCAAEGQRLVSAPGWRWRFPASWTARPEVPAWAPDASRQVYGRKYFTAFEVQTLTAAEVAQAHRRLLDESATYRFWFEAPPPAMRRLRVRNSHGHEMEVFFPEENTEKHWGFPCVPACRPEYAFVIERLGK